MKPGLGAGLLAAAAFMFMLTWILGICSTSLTDWWYIEPSSTAGRHEGIWSTCTGDTCFSTNQYSGGCKALLDTVRAFSILTIIFAFFTMCLILAMIFLGESLWFGALICGVLTMCFAVLPWSIYMGFLDQCVPWRSPGITKGAGWCLAVSCLPMAIVGLMFLGMWYCFGRGEGAAGAAAGATGMAGAAGAGGAACVPAGYPPAYGAGAYPGAYPGAYSAYPGTYSAYPGAAPAYGAGYYPPTYTGGAAYPTATYPTTYTAAPPMAYYPGTPMGSPMIQI